MAFNIFNRNNSRSVQKDYQSLTIDPRVPNQLSIADLAPMGWIRGADTEGKAGTVANYYAKGGDKISIIANGSAAYNLGSDRVGNGPSMEHMTITDPQTIFTPTQVGFTDKYLKFEASTGGAGDFTLFQSTNPIVSGASLVASNQGSAGLAPSQGVNANGYLEGPMTEDGGKGNKTILLDPTIPAQTSVENLQSMGWQLGNKGGPGALVLTKGTAAITIPSNGDATYSNVIDGRTVYDSLVITNSHNASLMASQANTVEANTVRVGENGGPGTVGISPASLRTLPTSDNTNRSGSDQHVASLMASQANTVEANTVRVGENGGPGTVGISPASLRTLPTTAASAAPQYSENSGHGAFVTSANTSANNLDPIHQSNGKYSIASDAGGLTLLPPPDSNLKILGGTPGFTDPANSSSVHNRFNLPKIE